MKIKIISKILLSLGLVFVLGKCSPVSKEEDALPPSKLHFSVHNRSCLAGARQDHVDVRWHIIASLGTHG